MRNWAGFLVLAACGGAARGSDAQGVTICPAGSMLDPDKHECVAMDVAKPVATDATDTPRVLPPPPSATLGVDVRCTFQKGWVALLPASEYPKDDEFLMQALIGLTKEPSFWNGLPEYQSLKPYAAQTCTDASPARLVAQGPGDYFLVAGQEDTFSLRGKYDKNGVRRKMTLATSTSVTLGERDLTFTWDCISCPWIVFRGERGRDLAPFVVLANRRGRGRRGRDVHVVPHVPVEGGRVALRVVEIEREETHLESLVLRVNGRELSRSPALRLGPHTEATLSYDVPGVRGGFVDVEVEATGYYDLL